jgi:hypothetical protein
LASIHDAIENEFVYGNNTILLRIYAHINIYIAEISSMHSVTSTWQSALAWIGMIDRKRELPHQFEWEDGSTVNFTNWAAVFGHPLYDVTKNCAFIYTDYNARDVHSPLLYKSKWGNFPCDYAAIRAFICKQPAKH